jgi:hypothetical protein
VSKDYNQLVLETDCRYIAVFATHCGTYRYKLLNFGIQSAAEIFQKSVESVKVAFVIVEISVMILFFNLICLKNIKMT